MRSPTNHCRLYLGSHVRKGKSDLTYAMIVSFKLPVLPLRKSKVWTVSGASSGTLSTFLTVRLALATIGRLFSLCPELKTVGPNSEAGGEVVAPGA